MRPSTRYVDWDWEWRDNGSRFHVPHFESDASMQGRGHGSRALCKILEFAIKEEEADVFSIQMGGGAHSARWLERVSENALSHTLRVVDVEGYEDGAWRDPEADRVDGREDRPGDNHSSVYAVMDDPEYLAYEQGWEEVE